LLLLTLLLLLLLCLHLQSALHAEAREAMLTSTLLGASVFRLLCTAARHCKHAVATATRSACCNLLSTSLATAAGRRSHKAFPLSQSSISIVCVLRVVLCG
jgi:hypothetical protein